MEEPTPDTLGHRLRLLLALEVRRVVTGLEERRELLASLWAKARAREPMLQTLHSRWDTVDMQHLLTLDTEQVLALEAFYGLLGEVRIYVSFTEDMPTTMLDEMDAYRAQLRELAEEALRCLAADVELMRPSE